MASTTKWGPASWDMLFNMALNVDLIDKHVKDNHAIQFFNVLGYMLPCRYCVEYYAIILKDMPIENVLGTNRDLEDPYGCFRWLYHVKNKVNEKLIRQETECLVDHFLKKHEDEESMATKLLFTQPTPSFQQVLLKYTANRVDCNKMLNQKLQSCRHIPNLTISPES